MNDSQTAVQDEKRKKISRILDDIKDSEKKADIIIENAAKEKESIISEANSKSSSLLMAAEDNIKAAQDKKVAEHKEKIKAMKEKKLQDGRKIASEAEYKAQKNVAKAVSYVMRKIEEKVG